MTLKIFIALTFVLSIGIQATPVRLQSQMTDLGNQVYTALPAQTKYPFACANGWHPKGEDCVSNTDYCEKGKWIALTTSCGDCNWYTFHVKNTTEGSKTGDYCETRWYMLWLFIFALLLLIAFFVWLAWFLCCKGKKASRYQQIDPKPEPKFTQPEVQVHAEKPPPRRPEPVIHHRPEPVYHAPEPVYHAPEPVYHAPEPVYHAPVEKEAPNTQYREVRGEPVITYGEPKINESRVFDGHRGTHEKILVEKRTYSPDHGKPQVEHYGHEDWGKISNARFSDAHPQGRVAIGHSHIQGQEQSRHNESGFGRNSQNGRYLNY